MRITIAGLVLGALAADARADVFAFKDLAGFEACLRTDHLVEKVDTANGSQTRRLSEPEIQARCIEAAVKLAAAAKPDQILELVQATKRLSAPVNAIDLVGVLAGASLPSCNELDGYEVVMAALAMPGDGNVQVGKARRVVKRCLKDPAFRKDFLDEQDSSDPVLRRNVCAILVEEKLVKACKGAR